MARILCFDPGAHTGVAYWTGENYLIDELDHTLVLPFLLGTHREKPLDAVVVEDYKTAGHLTHDARLTLLLEGEIIGACKALDIPCHTPDSQKMGPFVAEARSILQLRKMKLNPPHKLDALAHLLSFQWRMKHDEPL